jgi:hypothetical protein
LLLSGSKYMEPSRFRKKLVFKRSLQFWLIGDTRWCKYWDENVIGIEYNYYSGITREPE